MSPLDVRLDTSLELLLAHTRTNVGGSVLATIVATAGSTYRKPGARMLIMADGTHHGLLSGGCLEGDLALHADQVRTAAAARAVEYDMRGPNDVLFGSGTGCEGAMRVLLEPLGTDSAATAALAAASRTTMTGCNTTLILVHESEDLTLGTYEAAALPPPMRDAARIALAERASRELVCDLKGHRTRAWVEYLAPSPHLLLCGGGPDARAVVMAALTLGWRVSVVDHRPAYASAMRFPGATVYCADPRHLRAVVALERCHAVVVMSHHLPSDVHYLRALAEAGVPAYVGLLGPIARRQRIAHELGDQADVLNLRLRGPVGLSIGAVTPEGIALAIVTEIHAWLSGHAAPTRPWPVPRLTL
jgi:xanthine dehydrogenase accessory factor